MCLSDVLRAVRLTGAIYFDMNFRPPFVGESPPMSAIAGSVMPEAEHVISFHMLLTGSCFAEIVGADFPPARLEPGDVVIFPMGDANVVTSTPGLRATPDLANYYRPLDRQLPFVPNRAQRGGEDEVRFVCGYFGCDARPFNPLLGALPRLLHCPGGPDRGGWLAQVIRLAVEESDRHRTGGETILAKASELMFVEVVRRYLDSLPEDLPQLAGRPARTARQRRAPAHPRPPRRRLDPRAARARSPGCRARSSPTASPSTSARRR